MDYDSGFSGLPMKPPHLGILPSDVKVRPASHVLFDNSPLPDSVPAYSTLVGDSAAVTASNPRATLSNSRGGPIHVADIALRAPAAPVAQLNNNAEVDEAPGVNGDEVVCPYDPRLNVYNGGFRTGPGSVTTSQASALQAPRRNSPPRPTSPRLKMCDVLQQTSVPNFQKTQTRSRRPSGYSGSNASPVSSPRMSFRPESPRASDECLMWLKHWRADAHAEEKVQEMLTDRNSPKRSLEQRFAREQVRNPAYRNATKSATSLARRAKPPSWK